MNVHLLAAFVFLLVTLFDLIFDNRKWKYAAVVPAVVFSIPGVVWGLWDLVTSPRSIWKRIELAFWQLMMTDLCEQKLYKWRLQGKPLYANPFYNCSVLCKHGQWLTYAAVKPFANFQHQDWKDQFATLGFASEADMQEAIKMLGMSDVKVKPGFNLNEFELLDATKRDLLALENFGGRYYFRMRVNFPNTPVILRFESASGTCKMRINYDAIGEVKDHEVPSSLDSFVFFLDTLLFVHTRERHCCFVLEDFRPHWCSESWGYQLHSTSLPELQRRICANGERVGFTKIYERGVKYTE
ncbi:hypothetical protein CBR_g51952 [Chara braunii]|uniref:Uncharacterized protein n=1 Tax=Chara braunii TaxID=69332 RepID=A0A388K6H5_CHABU|nr:hypothetical protein CBR_g51952 [Chara braunii]|eukprot:GBG65652.1 hypothetical protein CBR_g51952 [Chara braunii]